MTTWDDRLMCHFHSLGYHVRGRIGSLYLAEGECCDMAGCVALFEAIDRGVTRIQTYSGTRRDTCYSKRAGRWEATL